LVHFSYSGVFDNAIFERMDDKHPGSPTTTYTAGKAAAGSAIESYVKMFDLIVFLSVY
jgi:UDP-glucose 4-epimerase